MPDSKKKSPNNLDPAREVDGVLIAFDFGMKRIGVAAGQSITRSANPLSPLAAEAGEPDWNKVSALINEWRPAALIVGIPFNMDDSEQWITQKAYEFAAELKQRYHLLVFGSDERLTTRQARADLFEQGGYRAIKKASVDSIAAKLILENWFSEMISE